MLVINVIKILDLFRLKDIYQAHAMEWMKERKKETSDFFNLNLVGFSFGGVVENEIITKLILIHFCNFYFLIYDISDDNKHLISKKRKNTFACFWALRKRMCLLQFKRSGISWTAPFARCAAVRTGWISIASVLGGSPTTPLRFLLIKTKKMFFYDLLAC